jgi:hypothetical protein
VSSRAPRPIILIDSSIPEAMMGFSPQRRGTGHTPSPRRLTVT